MKKGFFKYSDGILPNSIAIAFVIIAFASGLLCILLNNLILNMIGVLLIAEALIISAYLVHECAHGTIFRKSKNNTFLSNIMLWINGSCFFNFKQLQIYHVEHHTLHVDYIEFDYPNSWILNNRMMRSIIYFLEWLYIPVIELIMRWAGILKLLKRGESRSRYKLATILTIRALFFIGLGFVSIKALLLYLLSYIIFIQVLRLMDAHQHTYEVFYLPENGTLPALKKRDRAYEIENTYSNPLSLTFPWLNLLVLNFGYHTAHHVKPSAPWYRLPKLHSDLVMQGNVKSIPFIKLLGNFHKYRVVRSFPNLRNSENELLRNDEVFIGLTAVSFLY